MNTSGKLSSECISIAKAIGIILMVMGHAGCPAIISRFFSFFHMPLFFIMSGYCFKIYYVDHKREFIWKRIKGLYIPFIKYELLFLLLHNAFCALNIYNGQYGWNGVVQTEYTLREILANSVRIVCFMLGTEQLLGAYWFLKDLLFAAVLSLFLIAFVKKKIIIILVLIAMTIAACVCNLHVPHLALSSSFLLGATFFIIGYAWKTLDKNLPPPLLMLTPCIFVGLVLTTVFSPIGLNMHNISEWTVLPYLIIATAGTVMTVGVSDWISRTDSYCKTILLYVGKHTLAILTWHFLCFKVVSLAIIEFYHLPIAYLGYFPVIPAEEYGGTEYASFCIAYLLVGILMPLFIDWGITKAGNGVKSGIAAYKH